MTLWWLSKVKPMLGGPVWSAQLTLMSSKVEHMSPTDQWFLLGNFSTIIGRETAISDISKNYRDRCHIKDTFAVQNGLLSESDISKKMIRIYIFVPHLFGKLRHFESPLITLWSICNTKFGNECEECLYVSSKLCSNNLTLINHAIISWLLLKQSNEFVIFIMFLLSFKNAQTSLFIMCNVI